MPSSDPGVVDQGEFVVDETVLEDEVLVSKKDMEEWDELLKQRLEQLEESKKHYDEWSDKITRRRMFAYARLRKLHKIHNNRMKFYSQMNQYVATGRVPETTEISASSSGASSAQDGALNSEKPENGAKSRQPSTSSVNIVTNNGHQPTEQRQEGSKALPPPGPPAAAAPPPPQMLSEKEATPFINEMKYKDSG